MRFSKMHGCGNDFVVVEDLDDRFDLRPTIVRAVCRRHLGVGADGMVRLAPSRRDDADVFMDYRNADGGVVEMCGTGVRCAATWMLDHGRVSGDIVRIDTQAGCKTVRVTDRDARGRVTETQVDMGAPHSSGVIALRLPSTPSGIDVIATMVSMGNPHAVLLVEDLDKTPVERWGPQIEHEAAFPDGTNVEFITVPATDRVRGRIWERGVGETLASGTGASAMAVAAHLAGLADRHVSVELPGGAVDVEWTEHAVLVRGPAVEVFAGQLDDRWLAGVDA